MKIAFKILSTIFPKWTALWALEIFKKVRRRKPRERELPFFDLSNRVNYSRFGKQISFYEAGNQDGDFVLLIHGWEGSPWNFQAMIESFIEQGKHIVILELPAHGFSTQTKTQIADCAEHIAEMIKHLTFAQKRPIDIVTHSFGSSALGFALSAHKLKINSWVMVTHPFAMTNVFKDFGQFLGLSSKSYEHMISVASSTINQDISYLNMANFIQDEPYNHLLLVHDQHDKVLSVENSIRLHKEISNSELHIPLSKKGHYRILWDSETIGIICSYLRRNELKFTDSKSPSLLYF